MKGILLKEGLFNSVVEGDKIQTRRLLKIKFWESQQMELAFNFNPYEDEKVKIVCNKEKYPEYNPRIIPVKSRYKIGDIVYLKEPYLIDNEGKYMYKYRGAYSNFKGFKNKLFMPEVAARYFIKITYVSVERLHKITTDEIKKEGIHLLDPKATDEDYKKAWIFLWDKINKSICPWESNPFVWVYDFELIVKDL